LYYLAVVARERGDGESARALFAEALQCVHELGHMPGVAVALIGLAGLEHAEGRHRRAAVLLAVAREIHRRTSLSMSQVEEKTMQEIEDASRAALGPQELDRAMAEGRQLSADQAVALALSPALADPVVDRQ
jgi:hypothetical protein